MYCIKEESSLIKTNELAKKSKIEVWKFDILGKFSETKKKGSRSKKTKFKGYLYLNHLNGRIKGTICDHYGDSMIQGKMATLKNSRYIIVFYKIYNIKDYFIYVLHSYNPRKHRQQALCYKGEFRTDSLLDPYFGQVKMEIIFRREINIYPKRMEYTELEYPEGFSPTKTAKSAMGHVDFSTGHEVYLQVEAVGMPFASKEGIAENIDGLMRREIQKMNKI